MDISALSIVLNQANVKQQVNLSLMKTVMDTAQTNSADLLKALEQSVQPHLGSRIDIKG